MLTAHDAAGSFGNQPGRAPSARWPRSSSANPTGACSIPTTPPSLNHLLRRCLTKDAKLRLRDIGEARIALAPGAMGRVRTRLRPGLGQRRQALLPRRERQNDDHRTRSRARGSGPSQWPSPRSAETDRDAAVGHRWIARGVGTGELDARDLLILIVYDELRRRAAATPSNSGAASNSRNLRLNRESLTWRRERRERLPTQH